MLKGMRRASIPFCGLLRLDQDELHREGSLSCLCRAVMIWAQRASLGHK